MKKALFTIIIIVGAFGICVINSCKKDNTPAPNPTNTNATTVSNNNTFADDQNMYSSENTQTDGDITSDIETNQSSMARTVNGVPTPQTTSVCGASVTLSNDTLTYAFNGTTACYGRTRSGTILVSANGLLRNPNTVLTITFVNYKVTRLYDRKSITFNGTKTLTDIGGFTWLNVLAGQDTIQVRERAYNMHVTFSGGATAVWNSARISKWSYGGGIVYFSCNGDSLAGGHNLTEWGTDRFNQSFVVYVNTIYSANSNCGSAYPTSGEVVYNVNNSTLTLTLGTDQNGNPLNSGCPGYFKIAWVLGNGDNGTAVFAYY
jgi:hypothetical protein